MAIDWTASHVKIELGWQRLNDFCDTGPRGSSLTYTSAVCMEEIEEAELGLRVVEAHVMKAVDGWDVLLDLQLETTTKETT